MKTKSLRRIVRERVLQILYAYEMNPDQLEALFTGTVSDITDGPGLQFARELVDRTIIHSKEFDPLIEKQLLNWEMDRLAIIDRVILRMGLCEFLYFDDIPPKVTINECIELSKEFCAEESRKFINGTLDKMLLGLQKNGKFQKTGRGLIASSKSKD